MISSAAMKGGAGKAQSLLACIYRRRASLRSTVDLGVLQASLVLPPSGLLPACFVQLPAPLPVAYALPLPPHAAPIPAAPVPPPSPGQCFEVNALVCIVVNTNPCHRPNAPLRTINHSLDQITNHHAVAQCSPPTSFCDSREIRRKR